MDSSKSISNCFEQHLTGLVERRNQIVHHFGEVHGEALRSGNFQKVIEALRTHLADVDTLRDALAQIAIGLSDALRDTTFKGTAEYQQMDSYVHR